MSQKDVGEKARGNTNCLSYMSKCPLLLYATGKKKRNKTEEPLAVVRLLLPTSNLLVSSYDQLFNDCRNNLVHDTVL